MLLWYPVKSGLTQVLLRLENIPLPTGNVEPDTTGIQSMCTNHYLIIDLE
uniref:Uncharacterized protein n=1 Tax=Arion vulgaris TaxID=1028688 RepID=A0A0B6ZUI7_9EUPU